ncbi:Meiotically up-regulated 151 protein [Beauveria bassiana]|uniref:Meiotically up-regulated 151 protein n=1 Tax=Beauveria bassiana TaxID=176275 RepID=A0A2N6NF25_BEABA|nr:Meiotically up-regulated 151 protein [Beauveria bassiana]
MKKVPTSSLKYRLPRLPNSSALPLGPSLPPVALPSASASSSSPSPSSPYTTTRSLIHDLTLPSIPNFDIPPSPPRSRSPSSSSSSATTKKFEQFLSLKKTGTHLNAKLEQSSALRNPALMDKLLDFVDVLPPGGGGGGGDGQGRQKEKALQYQTTLSAELWDPGAFPEWAFRDGLRRSSAKVAKEREMARAAGGRSSVDFVSGTMTAAAAAAAAGGGGLREKRKGGWQ